MDRVFMSYGKVLTGCCVVTSSEGCRRPGLFLSFHHPQTHEQVLNNSVAFRVCPALLCCAEKEKYSIPSATGSRLVLLLPGDMAQQGLSSSMHKYPPLASILSSLHALSPSISLSSLSHAHTRASCTGHGRRKIQLYAGRLIPGAASPFDRKQVGARTCSSILSSIS